MDEFHCSFCGKQRREVRKLISGPRVFICDECVTLCNDILAKEEAAERPKFPPPRAIVEELGVTFKAHDLTVHYLRPMPPIEHGVATASFDAKTFKAKIQGGDVGNIKLGTGDLLITGLDVKDQFIKVGGDITSPMPTTHGR